MPFKVPADSPVRLTMKFHGQQPSRLDEMLRKVDTLRDALIIGLQNNYPARTERFDQIMPILKDPALVRIAQMAITQLGKEERATDDIEYVVHAFSGISECFCRLLQERQQKNTRQ